MEPPASTWTCDECHATFDFSGDPADTRCPECGSRSLTRTLLAHDGIGIRLTEHLTLKAKDPAYPSRKNPRREVRSGRRPDASGRAVDEWRLIDKGADKYEERIVDPRTSEMVHQDEGRLSEHHDHGSAKLKGNRKDDSEAKTAWTGLE